MKLIAKAKPVKIRIKSGGEEHTSLDSLKKNFNISDILPLLDGRLERWLYQQEEHELADMLKTTPIPDLNSWQGIMDFITIFFSDYIGKNSLKDLKELIEQWSTSSTYNKNNDYLLSYLAGLDIENAKFVYKHKDEWKLSDINWLELFQYYIEENKNEDAEAMYIYGKMILEENSCYRRNNKSIGYSYIDKAARKGWKNAFIYLEPKNKNINNTKQTYSNQLQEKNVDKIRKSTIISWRIQYEDYIKLPANPGNFENETEKAVWKFIRDCDEIYKCHRNGNCLSKAKKMYQIANDAPYSQFLSLYWRYVLGICGDTQYLQGLSDDVANSIITGKCDTHCFAFKTFKEKLDFVIDKLLNDLP